MRCRRRYWDETIWSRRKITSVTLTPFQDIVGMDGLETIHKKHKRRYIWKSTRRSRQLLTRIHFVFVVTWMRVWDESVRAASVMIIGLIFQLINNIHLSFFLCQKKKSISTKLVHLRKIVLDRMISRSWRRCQQRIRSNRPFIFIIQLKLSGSRNWSKWHDSQEHKRKWEWHLREKICVTDDNGREDIVDENGWSKPTLAKPTLAKVTSVFGALIVCVFC